MRTVKTHVAYGRGRIQFSVERGRFLGVLKNRSARGRDVSRLVSRQLDNGPVKRALKDIVDRNRRILVAVPDNTRSAHLKEILPELLKRIDRSCSRIDIIVATGLHKKHNARQLSELLGPSIVKRYRVLSHKLDKGSLISLGRTALGAPIVLDKAITRYDTIITLGVIEPHLYAGYSGGAKTIAIGLAGEDLINATHGVRFLDHPHTRLGEITRNPFQKTLWEVICGLDVSFSVNVVNDAEGRAVGAFCGGIKDVYNKGTALCRKVSEVEAKHEAGIVICGIGYPKDINLYQASRAINYVLNVDRPVLKEGGVLIIAAELRDGVGEGLSEKRFFEELKAMRSPGEFIKKTKRTGCVAGAHRAYMVARPLSGYKIIFVTKNKEILASRLPFPCFDNMKAALRRAEDMAGKMPKVYVIPKALVTITQCRKRNF